MFERDLPDTVDRLLPVPHIHEDGSYSDLALVRFENSRSASVTDLSSTADMITLTGGPAQMRAMARALEIMADLIEKEDGQ